jgi:hypothetical protein
VTVGYPPGGLSFSETASGSLRNDTDLHKWEFLHLMQLPWVNWQAREFMSRE